MPPVSGVLETSLYVADIERSRTFYESTLGLESLFADSRMCALSVAGRAVLLLFVRGASTSPMRTPGGVVPSHDGSGELHVAFAIPADSLDDWESRLRECGVEIESRVRWPRGGTSLYFRDPDRHVVELATPGLWAIY